jgi:hypothetical protein
VICFAQDDEVWVGMARTSNGKDRSRSFAPLQDDNVFGYGMALGMALGYGAALGMADAQESMIFQDDIVLFGKYVGMGVATYE